MRTSGLADMAGTILAGRYRLTATIGTGASGQVYAAWDARLRRRVAVKVLHPGLAADVGFLRRFRAEAQLAASLHHPNVVTIFDWGSGPGEDQDRRSRPRSDQDRRSRPSSDQARRSQPSSDQARRSRPSSDQARRSRPSSDPAGAPPEAGEMPFIVLELLCGGSLRALLDSGARLSPEQAAAVGRQVAAALAYAHSRGLVHRDVKPANLLFDERGTVKVGDFGLVRALAEASWTEPAGSLLGTVRYAAPEQVQGRADGRSDQYALALLLVESVTGVVPFGADTSLSSLLARVETPLAVPGSLGPLVPVLERAGMPDPAGRWPDAAAFGAALAAAASNLPAPGPFPLAGCNMPAPDVDPTQIGLPSGPLATPTTKRRWGRRGGPTAVVVTPPVPAAPAPARSPASAPPAPSPPARPPSPREPDISAPVSAGRGVRQPRRHQTGGARRLVVPVMATLLVAGLAGGVFAAGRAAGTPARVPNLVSRAEGPAADAAVAAGFRTEIRRIPSDDPKGTVLDHEPHSGTLSTEGRTIRLVVSSGPRPVLLPSVTGRDGAEARAQLERAGFEVTASRAFDEAVPAGAVVRTEPAGDRSVAPGSQVRLVISDGPQPVEVPDVEGRSYADAARRLGAAHLTVARSDEFSDDVDAGEVIRQNPPAGVDAPRDSTVKVVVSRGPDLVEVPDVRGEDLDDAIDLLEAEGFEVDVIGYGRGRSVKRQDPRAGDSVRRGETVTLLF